MLKKDFGKNENFLTSFHYNLQVPIETYLGRRLFGYFCLFQKCAHKRPWTLIQTNTQESKN